MTNRAATVLSQIALACERVGRLPSSVSVVIAIKGRSIPDIVSVVEQFAVSGIYAEKLPSLGENYLKEYLHRQCSESGAWASLQQCPFHFIGPLQSNKLRGIVQNFSVVESVASEKHLRLISVEAARIKKVIGVYLQVNISADEAKQGFTSEEVVKVVPMFKEMPFLCLQGLMTITRHYPTPEEVRPDYRALNSLRNKMVELGLIAPNSIYLSMGMSQDFTIAIEEGADVVRLGTALFED
jgi:pyridoxal phosphate enzyme (YggS family)